MPIKDRSRYPKDWKDIVARIKARAGGRCECLGECGAPHAATGSLVRCSELHGTLAYSFRGKVVLTTAHLDHTPENCADDNLKAMCQRCHLRYDRHQHAETARKTRQERLALGSGMASRKNISRSS
jgi:hypothetical protein